MIKSMTGFGKAQTRCGNLLISFELRTLNGKSLDCSIKLPQLFKELEPELRNIFSSRIQRGKTDCSVSVEAQGEAKASQLYNREAFLSIYSELKSLAESVNADPQNLMLHVLNQPEVRCSDTLELSDEQKEVALSLCAEAVSALDEFRVKEGAILRADFEKRIAIIGDLLAKVDTYERERCPRIKERILSKLNEVCKDAIDNNRLEQEMIYYLEKLDITEEKVRLRQHLDYFLQTMESEENQGRKLSFIAQEMGREINTLGSKANDADLQVLVVKMKDELEKIKEQIANVL